MFSLRNITSFSEFKKMNEAVDIGTEFSNTTKLKDSLVGQAVSGIFSLIKKGIDAIRLEYFKRKLENEYFAGVLRYCKSKNIDLKNPQPLAPLAAGNTDPNVQSEIVEIKNDILLLRFNVTGWESSLNAVTIAINAEIGSIPTGVTVDDFELIRDNLILYVTNINKKFETLSTSTSIQQDLDNIRQNISEINKLILNSPTPPETLEYVLSSEEKGVLTALKTTNPTNPLIITNVDAVLAEEYNFDENYDLINEKVNNSSGTGIGFILGDELSKQGVGKFLADQGVNNVEDINFEQLASIFDDKMKSEATNSVNKNAIYRIAASVSNIITVTKSNSKKGTTKGEPTSFMTSWQKKVSDVKGEFSKFLNVDDIDPITMKGLTNFIQNPKNSADLNAEASKLNEIDRIQKIISYGSPNIVDTPLSNFGVIRILRSGNFSGPLFKLEATPSGSLKIYKYIGYLDFDKMIKDSDTTHQLLLDDTTKSWFWKGNRIGTNVSFLPNRPKNPNGGTLDLIGIYFVFNGKPISRPSGEPKEYPSTHIFYVYMNNGNGDNEIQNPTAVEVYSLDNANNLKKIDPGTIKLESTYSFKLSVGKTFEINSPLKDSFNDTIRHVKKDFLNFVTFKT